MIVHRGFKYRIYPTPEQEAKLFRWEGVLRFLWNLGLEQWNLWMARPRGERRYPTAINQGKELTALREEHPWIAEVPRNICEAVFFTLEASWRECFDGQKGPPSWWRKSRPIGLRERHACQFRVGPDYIKFPKLGHIRAVIHRPLNGVARLCTIRRDGDQWFAGVTCEVQIADPTPSIAGAIGIDRGVANLIADSQGRRVEPPKHWDHARGRIARVQRAIWKRKKGSKNRGKLFDELRRLNRKVRRQREHVLHVESHRYAKSHGIIVMEKLHVTAMTASAKGTVETPGKSVKAKAGLNRSILAAGWGKFAAMLKYKVVPEGGVVREVPAAYTSQTCSACGVIDPASRPSQAVFCCTGCGHTEHADTNAAKNILARGLTTVEPTVAGCGGPAEGRPKKQQTRPVRAA